jgi:hypothetical protein
MGTESEIVTPPSVFLAMPVYDGVNVATMMSVVRFMLTAIGQRIRVELRAVEGISLIELARAQLTRMFLESTCTHLMFVDADMTFAADVPIRMLNASVDVVGCLAAKKTLHLADVIRSARAGDAEPELNAHRVNACLLDEQRLEVVRGAVRVTAIGTGLLLIRRRVIEELIRAHPERLVDIGETERRQVPLLFKTEINDGRWTGEDYAFCRLCRENGIALHALFDADIGHVGRFDYRANLRNHYRESTGRGG